MPEEIVTYEVVFANNEIYVVENTTDETYIIQCTNDEYIIKSYEAQ
jgi:hypothetical protein